jgi:2-hydroxy-3-oxopropionate reductase
MTQTSVGFIGLGVMGRPMAANLIKAGHRLVVHRDSALARAELPEARFVSSAAEVAAQATAIVLMLPDTPDVEAVAAELDDVAHMATAAVPAKIADEIIGHASFTGGGAR